MVTTSAPCGLRLRLYFDCVPGSFDLISRRTHDRLPFWQRTFSRKTAVMQRTLTAWTLTLFAVVAFVPISVRWLDRPIATFFGKFVARNDLPIDLADRIFSIPSIATILFVFLGLVAISGRGFGKPLAFVALCTIGILNTTVVKDQLKFVFARTWPYLLQHDIYEFHFFQSARWLESFPSGHAAVAAGILSMVWIVFPGMRAASAIMLVAVNFLLVALDLHFLSDAIAGTFVGVSMGLFTIAIWRMAGPLIWRL
jgi:membrane-associated phospholipid phosphatase